MGKFYKGILGGFTGKIGTVIGSNWNGVEYMRSKSGPRKGNFSQKQLEQQAKFGVAVKFLQPLLPALNIGYRSQNRQLAPLNRAVSDLLQNAIVGDYPDYAVDYESVQISQGVLLPPSGYALAAKEGELSVTWKNPKRFVRGSVDDQVLLVAVGDGCIPGFALLEATRGQGAASVELPIGEVGAKVYVYLAFASPTGLEVSNSVMVGELTL